MNQFLFSPITDKNKLVEAIKYIHFSCYKLCKQSFGKYLPNAGNMGVFCHYDDEYQLILKIKEELTEPSNNPDQKYYRLYNPIVIPTQGDVPETIYTHLYIRKPDTLEPNVGDVDFYLEPEEYLKLKESLLKGEKMVGARVYNRPDLDMIELFDTNIQAMAYVSTKKMTEAVRVKIHTPQS